MPILSLGEVIIYVEDMQSQVEFYRDKLGLAVAFPTGTSEFSNEFWVTFDCGNCVLALHGGGKRRFGSDAPKFVFDVDDIQAARAEIEATGVKLDETFEAAPGVLVANGTDPEGNKFSIEQNKQRLVKLAIGKHDHPD